MGIAVWCQDEAGPFQTVPYAAPSWQPEEHPQRQSHEYLRNGTAKLLTLFHPADGIVRVKGVESAPNAVLHPWLKQELTPLSGSWLNMAESMQRILKRRALDGQHPETPQQIIERLETAAQVWNQHPTPFEWGGKRAARRQRARWRQPQHRLGGSGAFTRSATV